MHVDRVGVVHDVLPAAEDVLPLGQVAPEQAHVVHLRQRPHHAVLRVEDAEEGLRRLGVALQRLVADVEVVGDEPPRGARERHAVLLGGAEGGEQPDRPLAEMHGVGDLEAVADHPEPVLGEPGGGRRRGRTAPRRALLEHDLGEGADGAGVPVVLAHEALHRERRAVVGIAEARGHPLLVLEVQLVGLAAHEQVQLVADPPEEVERAAEALHLVLGEQPHVEQVVEAAHRREHRARDPERGVVVAQAAGALLQVRLEQEQGLAVLAVALRDRGALTLDEAGHVPQQVPAHRVDELVEQLGLSGQKARGEQRGGHGGVAAPELDALLDAARGAAQGDPGVPEPVLDALRDVRRHRRQLVPVQEQDVDVGAEGHLAPGVAPHGDQRRRLAELAAALVPARFAELDQLAQQAIDAVRVRLVHRAARRAALVARHQGGAQVLEVAAHALGGALVELLARSGIAAGVRGDVAVGERQRHGSLPATSVPRRSRYWATPRAIRSATSSTYASLARRRASSLWVRKPASIRIEGIEDRNST